MTLILAVLLLSYSLSSFIIFFSRENYVLLESRQHNGIKTSDSFGKKDNFVIAAGLSGSELLDDPDIGQLKFIMKKWDLDFEATYELKEL